MPISIAMPRSIMLLIMPAIKEEVSMPICLSMFSSAPIMPIGFGMFGSMPICVSLMPPIMLSIMEVS
eukprot:10498835-Alexandrium_andersonii.AAC.1